MRTSKNIRALVAGALLTAGGQAVADEAPLVSINIGINGANVSESEEGCGGGQGGITFGRTLLVRLQATHVSYEADDDTDTCDAGYWGDSDAREYAATAGFQLGRSGLFVAGGPARVDFEKTGFGAWGTDTGTRVEFGWSSRLANGGPVGVELTAFHTDTDVRDFTGMGVSVAFGGRSAGGSARRSRGPRY